MRRATLTVANTVKTTATMIEATADDEICSALRFPNANWDWNGNRDSGSKEMNSAWHFRESGRGRRMKCSGRRQGSPLGKTVELIL